MLIESARVLSSLFTPDRASSDLTDSLLSAAVAPTAMSHPPTADGPAASPAQVQDVFARFAVHPAGGPSVLPLVALAAALRTLGVRLMAEDVADLEQAARPYAPLTQAHFQHFHRQAIGRHLPEAEVRAAVEHLGEKKPTSQQAPAAGGGDSAANAMSLDELRRLVITEGDALSANEWAAFVATLPTHVQTAPLTASVKMADLV